MGADTLTAGFDSDLTPAQEPKSKINFKNSGQECPFHTNAPREFWAQGWRDSPFFPRVGKGDVADGFQAWVADFLFAKGYVLRLGRNLYGFEC